jgi:hypothetical protein
MKTPTTKAPTTLDEIRNELKRVSARQVRVDFDDDFEPRAGRLLKVDYDGAYWHLLPENFLELLRALPDEAGPEAVKREVEKRGPFVWHGPSPPGSRDTSA